MTSILGKSVATAYQMSTYLLSINPNPLFTRDISALDFCQLFLDVCAKENVRGDIAFAQACKETGNFKFKGDVRYTQNNFAGLGATGNGVCGCLFRTIEIGILAQAQHLKTYATKDALTEKNVDPRRTSWFYLTRGGTSHNVETLGGTWAVPGYSTKLYMSLKEANEAQDSYGYQIMNILNNILKVKDNTVVSPANIETKYFRVNCGSFKTLSGAKTLQKKLKVAGFDSIIKEIDGYKKVQVSACSLRKNAEKVMAHVKEKGFDAFIVYQ